MTSRAIDRSIRITICGALLATACEKSVVLVSGEDTDRTDSGSGGCAAVGNFTKGTGDGWDGTVGNPYGYPPGAHPGGDCSGFGFSDQCSVYGSCFYPCSLPTDCPGVADGPAPLCRVRDGQRTCVLPCASEQECPAGMKCVTLDQLGRICAWPL